MTFSIKISINIKATYSNLVYSPYEPLYSFNTLVSLLNSIFVKMLFSNNTSVLKEYIKAHMDYIQDLSK